MKQISGSSFRDQLTLTMFEIFANTFVHSFASNPKACKPKHKRPLEETLSDPFDDVKLRTRKLRPDGNQADAIEHAHLEGLSNSINVIANALSNLHRSGKSMTNEEARRFVVPRIPLLEADSSD